CAAATAPRSAAVAMNSTAQCSGTCAARLGSSRIMSAAVHNSAKAPSQMRPGQRSRSRTTRPLPNSTIGIESASPKMRSGRSPCAAAPTPRTFSRLIAASAMTIVVIASRIVVASRTSCRDASLPTSRYAMSTRTIPLAKANALAELLRELDDDDLAIACRLFAGSPFGAADQRVLGTGWSAIIDIVLELSQANEGELSASYQKHADVGDVTEELLAAH